MNEYKKLFNKAKKVENKKVENLKKEIKQSINQFNEDEIKVIYKYIDQHIQIIKHSNKIIDMLIEKQQLKLFEFYSANVSKLIPEIPQEKHFELFYESFKWKLNAPLQLHNPFMLSGIKNFSVKNSQVDSSKSVIYCTFQYGSSLSTIGYLIANNINIVLLVDEKTYANKDIFTQQIKRTEEFLNKNILHEIINVEDKGVILKLVNFLRKGYSALAYLDGNDGIGGVYNKQAQLIKIPFLSDEILVRKGISYISYITKTSIVPILCSYNKSLCPVFYIYPAIIPDSTKQKEEFCIESSKKIWGILEENIRENPAQWNGWEYVHKYYDFEKLDQHEFTASNFNLDTSEKIKLNKDLYRIFKIDDQFYLFNRYSYKTYPIDKLIYNILLKEKGNKINTILKGVDKELLNDLIAKKVFISI